MNASRTEYPAFACSSSPEASLLGGADVHLFCADQLRADDPCSIWFCVRQELGDPKKRIDDPAEAMSGIAPPAAVCAISSHRSRRISPGWCRHTRSIQPAAQAQTTKLVSSGFATDRTSRSPDKNPVKLLQAEADPVRAASD